MNNGCRFCGKLFAKHRGNPGVYCSIKCKADWQRTQKPLNRDQLFQMYVIDGMDCTQIASVVSRDPKSVWNWLKGFGIQTRKRGDASAGTQFKAGQESRFKGMRHTEETKSLLRDIAIADGRVPFDPAIGPPLKGKRGASVPTWKGGVTPQRQAFYSTQEWKAASRAVWKRDAASCQRCGRKKSDDRSVSFDVHHIVGFDCVRLRSEVSNLVLLCEPCHYWVHSSENVDRIFIKENIS